MLFLQDAFCSLFPGIEFWFFSFLNNAVSFPYLQPGNSDLQIICFLDLKNKTWADNGLVVSSESSADWKKNHHCVWSGWMYHHIIILLFWEFLEQADGLPVEFEWLQVTRTHLSILAHLKNAVFRRIIARLLISKSYSSCTNSLLTISNAPITIGIIVTFMFQIFFDSLARARELISFFDLFQPEQLSP